MADWEEIRTFLAVARAGTLAAAGRVLGVDYTTVGRRVRALEQELGLTLFERVRDRYVLTESAEGLREAAERMEDGALSLERRALGADRTVSGILRIATTDALSRSWSSPRSGRFTTGTPTSARTSSPARRA